MMSRNIWSNPSLYSRVVYESTVLTHVLCDSRLSYATYALLFGSLLNNFLLNLKSYKRAGFSISFYKHPDFKTAHTLRHLLRLYRNYHSRLDMTGRRRG